MNKQYVVLFLSLLWISTMICGDTMALDEESYSEESSSNSEVPVKKRAAKVYGVKQQTVAEFCYLISKDGRLEEFAGMLKTSMEYDGSSCPECRGLLKIFLTSCKPKKIKQPKPSKKTKSVDDSSDLDSAESAQQEAKNEESNGQANLVTGNLQNTAENVDKIPHQREPNLMLIIQSTQLFARLVEQREQLSLMKPAIDSFIKMLRENEDGTVASQEYFSALANYVEAPVRGELRLLENELNYGSNNDVH